MKKVIERDRPVPIDEFFIFARKNTGNAVRKTLISSDCMIFRKVKVKVIPSVPSKAR